MNLVGWYIPSENGAVIIAQHGYTGNRDNMMYDAEMLHRHGYGVLVTTVRAHDKSDGEILTFGKQEMKDLEAWYQYLLTRDDLEHDKIAILGESMGGGLVLQYAAQNEAIKGVAVHSTFGSVPDTVCIFVGNETGMPCFPFVPIIVFWAEREAGFRASEIDTPGYISQLSPRPVFIMAGGKDDHVSPRSGHELLEAAGEPSELWFEEEAEHHGMPEVCPDKYEKCVVGFYDQYLLGEPGVQCSEIPCS
jgi:fermentation-respiration switch protein FrsA (DUF1100 family)